jgi:hypothetical protein
MAEIHAGSCNCGQVTFSIKGNLRDIMACHCSQCRKQSGLYFAATEAKDADLIINGAEHITWYSASEAAKRGFCRTCGSTLFWKHNELDRTSILAGAFDTPINVKITEHIFCKDRSRFYDISDGLPQYDGPPPILKTP